MEHYDDILEKLFMIQAQIKSGTYKAVTSTLDETIAYTQDLIRQQLAKRTNRSNALKAFKSFVKDTTGEQNHLKKCAILQSGQQFFCNGYVAFALNEQNELYDTWTELPKEYEAEKMYSNVFRNYCLKPETFTFDPSALKMAIKDYEARMKANGKEPKKSIIF